MKYSFNIEAAKISVLSSGKINKCEYPIGEEMLPPEQDRIFEQARFAYFVFGNVFEKQVK